jgi:glucokinase
MMNDETVAIGIDIGGTGAKGGLVAHDGQVCGEAFAATADDDSLPNVLASYERMIGNLSDRARALAYRVEGIGVGVPGYLDDSRSAMTYGNIRCLEGFDLRDHLAGRFGLPVRLDNDANCAALAEYYWGGGVGCSRLLVVTVGSGIGVGVIIDGKLIRYTFGTAGELGSIVVNAREAKPSFLGGLGGLESVASARAIMEAARSLTPQPTSVAQVAELACGNESAAAILRRAGWWAGVGIASWAAIFCPDKVLIGGGVAACGQAYLEAAQQSALEMAPAFYVQRLSIEFARMGNRAGCAGASSLILKHPE